MSDSVQELALRSLGGAVESLEIAQQGFSLAESVSKDGLADALDQLVQIDHVRSRIQRQMTDAAIMLTGAQPHELTTPGMIQRRLLSVAEIKDRQTFEHRKSRA